MGGPHLSTPTCDNPGMKKKNRFIRVVKILAPDNPFVFEAAKRIPEERLPSCPGAAALDFVVGLAGSQPIASGTARGAR